MRALSIAGAILFLGAGPVRAEPPARAALVVGVAVNVPPEQADEIARAFEAALEEALEVEVTIAAPGPDAGGGCAADAACLEREAARLGADRLLYLVLSGAGDRVRVEFSRAVSGAVVHPPALILEPDAAARAGAIRRAAADLLPGVAPRAAPEPPTPAAPAVLVTEAPTTPARDDGRTVRIAGVATLAAGAVLTGASIYVALRARSSADDLEERFANGGTWDDDARELEDRHHAQRTWAAVLGAAGGVALVAGGALLLWGGAF